MNFFLIKEKVEAKEIKLLKVASADNTSDLGTKKLALPLFNKFTRRVLSMMREVNILNNGNTNLLVPKSEVLSAEATFRSLISLASTFYQDDYEC